MKMVPVPEDLPIETRDFYFLLQRFAGPHMNFSNEYTLALNIGLTKAREDIATDMFLTGKTSNSIISLMINQSNAPYTGLKADHALIDANPILPLTYARSEELIKSNEFREREDLTNAPLGYDLILINEDSQAWLKERVMVYELAFSRLSKGGIIFASTLGNNNKKDLVHVINEFTHTPLLDITDDIADDVFKATKERILIYRR